MKKFLKSLKAKLFTHRKTKGEWAEIAFRAKALALGLSVSIPEGDNQPFDFIVTAKDGRMSRVQVKSRWTLGQGAYNVRARRSGRAYRPSEVDYLALYIPPHDAWYLMPPSAIPPGGHATLHPHQPGYQGPYEKYQNAWRLLTGDPADDHRTMGLTIHASVDD